MFVLDVCETSIGQLLCLDGSLLADGGLSGGDGAMSGETLRLEPIVDDCVGYLCEAFGDERLLLLLELACHMGHFRCTDLTVKEVFVVLYQAFGLLRLLGLGGTTGWHVDLRNWGLDLLRLRLC